MTRVLFAIGLGGLAGIGFAPVFGAVPGPSAFLIAVGAVTAVAGLVAVAATRLTQFSPSAATVGGALAVVVTAAAVSGTGRDMLNGPWQLLTGALPAQAEGPALAAVAVVAGWTTLAAGLLAAYATNPLAPLAPAMVCLVTALGLGASARALPVEYALALLVAVAGLLLTGRSAPWSPETAVAAALTALVAVAAAAVLGPTAADTGQPPADVRALVAGPVQPRSGVSPLQQYLALRNGIRPLQVTGTVSRSGSLLRLATLTRFDGGYWTVNGSFRRAGTILPEGRPAVPGVTVHQQVRVTVGSLDWMLTAGRATGLSVSGMGVDEATGDVAVPIDRPPPTEYTASSTVNAATVDEILAAEPVRSRDPLPPPPAGIRSFVDSVVSGQPPGSDQLLTLKRWFTTDRRFWYDESADAPGGHGYYQIQRLLESTRGTSEQYASAYAVMARYLGYDARVVMGFRPRYEHDTYVAAGQDVAAWVEVNFGGLGWISVDPSPRDNPIGTRPNVASAPSRSTALDDPLKQADQTPRPAPPAITTEEDAVEPEAAGSSMDSAVPVLATVSVSMVLLVGATPVAKAIRRVRRRRARSDRLAVVGAWHETLDRLREAGTRVTPAQTTGEVVTLVTGPAGPLAAHAGLPALAAAADRASYAPEEPEPALRPDAWAVAQQIRAQLRSAMHPVRRMAAPFDPRPLLTGPNRRRRRRPRSMA
jgi:transglutaminase-like putative cysteine protease